MLSQFKEGKQSADLVEDDVIHFLSIDLHLPPPESWQIGQRDMGADLDPVFVRQRNRSSHVVGIGAVKAAGDVGLGNEWHDAGIISDLVETEAFAHVTIDIYLHGMFP